MLYIFKNITPLHFFVVTHKIPLTLDLGSQEWVCPSLRNMNVGEESCFWKTYSLFQALAPHG